MKFLRTFNNVGITIVLLGVYGIAFGLAKILMIATRHTNKSSGSYWIPEQKDTNKNIQSPY